jgi:glutathione synthase/RimK-type ligase-like ATP-grasp enzyme
MPRIALVTAIASATLDDDMPLLLDACARLGLIAEVRAWDDFTVSWARYDAVVLRSPWDYHLRLPEFLRWCERVDRVTRLLNPLPIVRWNTDKHYLSDLAAAGIPVVPTHFVEPDAEPLPALQAFLAAFPQTAEIVVKPTVSAGSRDTQRYRRDQTFAAANHIGHLLDAGRSVMLQPYLDAVDTRGETALLYFDGTFSHAIRKAALLRPGEAPADHTQLADAIAAREPDVDELHLAESVFAALRLRSDGLPLYARVDLIRDADGQPRLLELELTEPSLFFDYVPGSADRFAMVLARRIEPDLQGRP